MPTVQKILSTASRFFTPQTAPENLLNPVRKMVRNIETNGLKSDVRYEWHPKNARSQTKYDTFVDTTEGIHIKPIKDECGNLKIEAAQIANGNESMTVNLFTGAITSLIKRPFFGTASGFLTRMQAVVKKINA